MLVAQSAALSRRLGNVGSKNQHVLELFVLGEGALIL